MVSYMYELLWFVKMCLEGRAKIVTLVPHRLLSTCENEVGRIHCECTKIVSEGFEFDVFLCKPVQSAQSLCVLL